MKRGDEVELKTCSQTGKLCYLSWEHANNDANAIGRKRPAVRKKFIYSVYICRYCEHFHVGSKVKEKKELRK